MSHLLRPLGSPLIFKLRWQCCFFFPRENSSIQRKTPINLSRDDPPTSSCTLPPIRKVKVLVAEWRPTLCDPMDCSPSGSSVHGFLQGEMQDTQVWYLGQEDSVRKALSYLRPNSSIPPASVTQQSWPIKSPSLFFYWIIPYRIQKGCDFLWLKKSPVASFFPWRCWDFVQEVLGGVFGGKGKHFREQVKQVWAGGEVELWCSCK